VRARAAASGVVLLDRRRRHQQTGTASAAGSRRAAIRVDGATTPIPGAMLMHAFTCHTMAAASRRPGRGWSEAWRRAVLVAAVSVAAVLVAAARGATASVCVGWQHLGCRPAGWRGGDGRAARLVGKPRIARATWDRLPHPPAACVGPPPAVRDGGRHGMLEDLERTAEGCGRRLR